jgi:hypothetical protein
MGHLSRIAAMRQHDFPGHTLIALLTLAGASLLPFATNAADFAATGTQGTLAVKVEAVGGARHTAGPGAGLDAREWKIKNTGQFTIHVRATDPVADDSPENRAKAEGARGAFQQTVTESGQEVMDKWEEKIDACNGDEGCENRVRGQMMSDPRYQQIIQRMQGAGPAMAETMRAVDVAPRQQFWSSDPMHPSSASGSVEVHLTENVYGAIDSAGGGKVNGTCRWNGNQKIAPGSPESKVGASVRINAKTSTYEIRIPAEAFGARVAESCSDSKTGSHGPSKNTKYVPLIGRSPPRGVKDFGTLLTFKGPVRSTRSPQMRGRQTVTTEWLDASNQDPIPVKVTIDWQFSAGGR